MKIIEFKSEPRKTPFAPEYHYQMLEEFLAPDRFNYSFDDIAKLILKKEIELKEKYPYEELKKLVNKPSLDGYTSLGDSLTARYHFFNVFSWEESCIQSLKTDMLYIYKDYMKFLGFRFNRPKLWIRAWANVMRKGQEIKIHLHSTHPYAYLGGHVTVQCEDTATCYVNPINQINDPEHYISKNIVGQMTLFQQNIPHFTTMHMGDKERITIAFDLVHDDFYQTLDAKNQSTLVLFDEGES